MAVFVSNDWCKWYTVRETICCPDVEVLFSIQFNFICIALLKKGLLHSCFPENWPRLSKPRAHGSKEKPPGREQRTEQREQRTGRNLEQNLTQRGNHLPLVGTGFIPN